MKRIICWQDGAERGGDIRHQVNPDQVIKPEHARFGNPKRAAHQRISCINRNACSDSFMQGQLQRIDPDPVTQKAWCITASDHTFAQHTVIKISQLFEYRIIWLLTPHKFQEPHKAHRIEIMCDRIPAGKINWHLGN